MKVEGSGHYLRVVNDGAGTVFTHLWVVYIVTKVI